MGEVPRPSEEALAAGLVLDHGSRGSRALDQINRVLAILLAGIALAAFGDLPSVRRHEAPAPGLRQERVW